MKILHVSPTYFPATYWGGPIYSLHGLCQALARLDGVRVRVLTTDAAGPQRDSNLELNSRFVQFDANHQVRYYRRLAGISISLGLIWGLWKEIRWSDVVHLTGVYSFPTLPTLLAARLHGKPVVWSPRGALQRWQGSRLPTLKWVWERVCDLLLAPNSAVLHVTTEAEQRQSAVKIRRATTAVIRNAVDIPDLSPRKPRIHGSTVRLLFVGRLDPKKGLENLLMALQQLRFPFNLRVCGAGEANYVKDLQRLAKDLAVSDHVDFLGHIDGKEKSKLFCESDFCVVPSFTENFGMVVAESLAHGLPVIASTGTPWQELEERGCGLWVDNNPHDLARAIERICDLDLAQMGARGREWMQHEFRWHAVANQMRDLYAGLVAARTGNRLR